MERDITERKRQEAALEESQARLAAIFDQSTAGIAQTDLTGRFLLVNDRYCEITGRSRETLLTLRMQDITHPDDLPNNLMKFRALAEDRAGSFVVEKRYLKPDGSIVWVHNEVSPIRDVTGQIQCVNAVVTDVTESKKIEAALRESEARFRNMADNAPVMVWVTEPDGTCSFLSRSWYDFTGQTPETGLGFGWTNAVHPDDRPSAEQTFVEANKTHSPFRLEYRLRRHDGEYRWGIDAAAPRFSSRGDFLGYIGSVIDITERKQGEEALAANEEKYRHMFESAGVSLFEEDWSEIQRWFDGLRSEGVTDLGRYLDANPEKVATSIPLIRVTDVNEYAVRLFQAPSKTALLGALGRVFTPETTAVFREELIAFWEGLDLLEQPSMLRTVTGEPLSVLCNVKAPRHRGDWRRVLVAVTDVTALRKSEEFNRIVLENSPDCVKILDRDGRLQFMNGNGLCLLQLDDFEAIKDRFWWDLWPEEIQTTVRNSFELAIRGENTRFQAFRPTAKGTPKWWDVIVAGIPTQSVPSGRVIAVSRDVTERKRQEEELRRWKDELEIRVQERTGELLATQGRLMTLTSQLSLTEQRERRKLARDLHDYLAQMLVVGQMKTSMLKKQLPPNPAGTELLQDLDKIFQDALAYTRTLIAELSPPSLQDSGLPEALKWLGERFEKDGLRVSVRADCASVPLAEEQAVVVFQAVRELLFNVMKHAGVDQATVTLSLGGDGILRIAVADGGRGLTPEVLQHPAEPGHLGLVSVRERFRAMGGRIDVESSPGKGTTVTLVLPIGVPPKAGAEPHVPSAETSRLRTQNFVQEHAPIRVLLMDDHKLMRQGLRDILASDDRIRLVGEADNCEEALMLAANLVPDVVVADINLPTLNGIEVIKRFKKLHPRIVVIGLSVHVDEQIKRDMISAGAEALLSKECAADELTATIVNSHYKRATHP